MKIKKHDSENIQEYNKQQAEKKKKNKKKEKKKEKKKKQSNSYLKTFSSTRTSPYLLYCNGIAHSVVN